MATGTSPQSMSVPLEAFRRFLGYLQREFDTLQHAVHNSEFMEIESVDAQTSLIMLHLGISTILEILNCDLTIFKSKGLKTNATDWMEIPRRVSLREVNDIQVLLALLDPIVYPEEVMMGSDDDTDSDVSLVGEDVAQDGMNRVCGGVHGSRDQNSE